MTRPCHDIRRRLPDFLDELLDETTASEVTTHLAGCADCRDARDDAAAAHALLYTPYETPALPADLQARIERAALARRPAWGRVLLRYAATFAAGVLVTLVVSDRGEMPPTTTAPHVETPVVDTEPLADAGTHETSPRIPLGRIR